MKKIILCIALLMAGVGVATAQSDQGIGSYKANDLKRKADGLMQRRNSESYEQAVKLYQEAEEVLKADIEKAKTDGKNNKLAKLYMQSAQLQNAILNPEMSKAQQGLPFDTLEFCKRIDNIIDGFNNASRFNQLPNAKGKVKKDPIVEVQSKLGITSMLNLYYNCGAFMSAMNKKQESVDYFQKFVDLPASTPVFTKEEADSVYQKNAQIYTTARFNLALQNYYLKNWDQAIANADEALKDTANMHDLYLIKINAYGEKKDSVAWQQTLMEAAKRTGSQTYLQNLLYYYIQSNKIDDAVALAQKLVTEDPESKMAWFMKGAIELNVKKDYASARESFKKALEIDPDYKDALFNMGPAWINDVYELGTSGKLKWVGTNRTITGKQSDGSYARNKAAYEKELKMVRSYYENARPYLERLRELTPDKAKLWAPSLQMVYNSLGEKDKAKEMDELLDAANAAGNE